MLLVVCVVVVVALLCFALLYPGRSLSGRALSRGPARGAARRRGGGRVAVVAGGPCQYGGGWTGASSEKGTRFVDLAGTFHLPVVHLVDNPGFVIGTEAEQQATIRHGARALAAIYQATVPWCSILEIGRAHV